MSLDEILKGFAALNQGVTELAVSRATTDAQKQITDLNQQALNDKERLAAQNQIGQQLALRLQSAGAPADQIAATANRLSVSAGEKAQEIFGREQQESTQKFQVGQQERLFQQQKELQAMKMSALTGKNLQKVYDSAGDKFNKRPDVKPLLDNMPKIDDALEKIKETKGQMGASAMINLAQLGLIRGAAGRVNEKEIEGANESQSKRAQIWKRMGLEATGEVPMNIQDFWQKVMQRAKDNLQMHIREKAVHYSQELADMNDGIDANRIADAIQKGHGVYVPKAGSMKATPGVQTITPPQGVRSPGLPAGFSPIGQ